MNTTPIFKISESFLISKRCNHITLYSKSIHYRRTDVRIGAWWKSSHLVQRPQKLCNMSNIWRLARLPFLKKYHKSKVTVYKANLSRWLDALVRLSQSDNDMCSPALIQQEMNDLRILFLNQVSANNSSGSKIPYNKHDVISNENSTNYCLIQF